MSGRFFVGPVAEDMDAPRRSRRGHGRGHRHGPAVVERLEPARPSLPEEQPEGKDDPQPIDAGAEYASLLSLLGAQAPQAVPAPPVRHAAPEASVYQQLMAKERGVLDTVNRVVNDSWRKDADGRGLLQLPLHELGIRVMRAVQGLASDLVSVRSLASAQEALADTQRYPYLGVALIIVAAVLALL